MIQKRAEELAVKLEIGRRKTLEILNGLTTEQWQTPLYEEPPWIVHNLLAHFVSAERQLLALAQSVAAGGQGTPLDFDIDRYNAGEQKKLEGQSAQNLLALLDQGRRQTIEWIGTLGDDELDKIGRHPALGNVNVETMIRAIYGHQLIHMRELSKRLGSVV
jgi:hypothetical protein